ncbi:MAG: DUF4148 domain-containing protein [Burkholderia sp.]|nr:DUF4148 domain-containing protein [Burkholderia sp.]MCA3779693.1 DUF4148 domain-containing protein [Burkholderia sp.]MCA3794100.1 DUF4148 domain-containing protein [Burkholderia sp.]MCA3805003.1 DUF4148 domain-containing protein [Burkholderia sp.]MCA3813915.1 DUF4148 domain-containing protein [Burkholderia sp.]MCA3818642.1 DUF4148 domain-containing protein [Burkholderia sp.]
MKTLMFATLLSALCVALPGRASAMPPAAAAASQTLASAAPVPLPSQPAWNWNTPQAAPLTRAQVYRELIHAERDGQLAQLNRELYSH